jgi:iron complex outermembrane recepter protein
MSLGTAPAAPDARAGDKHGIATGYRFHANHRSVGDIGRRTENAEVHLNIDAAQTSLNGPGTVPVQLLQADSSAQFTGPNEINHNYVRVNLNGSFDITDTTSIQTVAYYDNLLELVLNGNGSPISPCPDGTPFLCESPGVVATTLAGTPIPTFLGTEGVYGSVATQTTRLIPMATARRRR